MTHDSPKKYLACNFNIINNTSLNKGMTAASNKIIPYTISFTMEPEDYPEDKPLPITFHSRNEAWEWVEQNHPGFGVFLFSNPDGTVGAFLEPPEDEVDRCKQCNESPCLMIEHKEQFEGLLAMYKCDENLANRQRRFKMYQEMTRLIHGGYLGKGNRKELPPCITEAIRNAFPNDPKEAYTGFQHANGNSES